jgi:hypothetical protein
VRGVLLEPPEEPPRRGGDPGLGGVWELGEAREEGPLLLASWSISADLKISGLAWTRNGMGDGREEFGGECGGACRGGEPAELFSVRGRFVS